jgi:hypothetical protein
LSHQYGKTQLLGDGPGLGQDGSVVSPDRRVEVHGGLPSVVRKDHGPAAEEIQLAMNSSALKVMGKAFERVLELSTAEKGRVHARARS